MNIKKKNLLIALNQENCIMVGLLQELEELEKQHLAWRLAKFILTQPIKK